MASLLRLVRATVAPGAALVLLVVAATLVASLAPAAAQGRIVARHGDWQTRCERPVGAPAELCALVQNVEAQDRANVSLTVIFLRTADRQARILRVLAPLGVLLPSGLGLSIDGNEVGLAGFVRCLPEGCIAEVELDDGLIERFEAGTTATFVIFQTPEEGIGIPISLAGFGDGFAALDNPPPPPEEVAADTAEPRAPVETPTSLVAADASAERFTNTFEADERTDIDRLLEDPLFPYVAGAAGLVLLAILGTIVLVVRGRGRRRRRREARDAREASLDGAPEEAAEPEHAEAPEPGPRTRTPPRLAKPSGEAHLPAVAPRERPRPPVDRPASPSAPRPPRP